MDFGNSTSYMSNNQTNIFCHGCIHFSFPAYSVIQMVNFLVGAPFNVWVLWLMLSSPSFLTDKMKVFEFNLAVNDLVFTLISPVVVISFPFFPKFSQYLMAAARGHNYFGRSFFQTCISLERYLAVFHPVVYLRYRPLRYRASILAPAWLMTFLMCYASVFMCTMISTHVTIIAYIQQFFFFAVNSFFSLSILRALFRPGPGDGRRGGGGEGEKDRMNLDKKRAFTTILIIHAAMTSAFVPNAVIKVLFVNISFETFCSISFPSNCLNLVMGLVLPVLHLRRAGKLKLDFLRHA